LAVVKQHQAASEIVEQALTTDPSGLTDAHNLTLKFADALMTRPGDLDDATVDALRQIFTSQQLIELTLKVLKFNTQKIQVALGTHKWITESEIDQMRWNQDGTYVVAT
jgi:hypothetical protein